MSTAAPDAATRLVGRTSSFLADRFNRRGFLVRTALAGSALVAAKTHYLLRPTSAYAAICNCKGQGCDCGSRCCEGWTEFCCTINNGVNACPPGSFAAGWWKADGSRYCDGPRYYIDCNAECRCTDGCSSGFCSPGCDGQNCGCANGDCDRWATGCNQFRYGQCHQEVGCSGRIVCRVVSCTPPWMIDGTCTTAAATANATANHHAPCLDEVPPVSIDAKSSGQGYWVMDAQGGVFAFGDAAYYGSLPELRREGRLTSSPEVVALVGTPSGQGYWIVDEYGGIFAFGDARFHGSVPQLRAQGRDIGLSRVTGLAPSATGNGYWLVDEYGGIFAFGDARFHGSVPQLRAQGRDIGLSRVTGLAPSATGNGYWLVDEYGGIFAFGDARFHGSVPQLRAQGKLRSTPTIVAITDLPDGDGYWLLDEHGGIFAFGDARFHGSLPQLRAQGVNVGTGRAVLMAPTPSGGGYWIIDEHGGVFTFGDARFAGRP